MGVYRTVQFKLARTGIEWYSAAEHGLREIIGPLRDAQTMAVGRSIRELARLRRAYGRGRWRKRKAVTMVRLSDGFVCEAEVHWYEATGIGRRELKVKRLVR